MSTDDREKKLAEIRRTLAEQDVEWEQTKNGLRALQGTAVRIPAHVLDPLQRVFDRSAPTRRDLAVLMTARAFAWAAERRSLN